MYDSMMNAVMTAENRPACLPTNYASIPGIQEMTHEYKERVDVFLDVCNSILVNLAY